MPVASAIHVFGRDEEIAAIGAFLENPVERALLLEGEAGIGKTTLWRAGVELAHEHGFRVLAANPGRAQYEFAYGALADLVSDVLDRLDELPSPQRRALAVALLQEEREGLRLEQRAVAVALLGLLRLLAEDGPMLVAVDDIQWLDRASALALEYALSRLEDPRLRVLFALRLEEASSIPVELERAFPGERLRRLAVGGLSAGALHKLIRRRLGLALTRPTLHRVQGLTHGNPFFALEAARAFEAHAGELAPGDPLPVPADVQELVRQRLRKLPTNSREALLAAAIQRQPRISTLERLLPDPQAALEAPLLAGVIELAGDRICFSHPLFASGIYALATPKRRRQLHSRLAEISSNAEEQALHAALAAENPDETVAALIEHAAELARARGAGVAASELFAHAVALTPDHEQEALRRRWVAQGQCFISGGEQKAGCALLEELIERTESGPVRAWLCALLVSWEVDDFAQMATRLRELLPEARGDARVSAFISRQLAAFESNTEQGAQVTLRDGQQALAFAEESGDGDLIAGTLTILASLEVHEGIPVHERLARADDLLGDLREAFPRTPWEQPRFVMSLPERWAGRLEQARALLEPIYERLSAGNNEFHLAETIRHMVDLEWRAGRWSRAAELADEGDRLASEIETEFAWIGLRFASAQVAASRGEVERARELAGEGMSAAAAANCWWDVRMHHWLLGFVELSLGDVAPAARRYTELAADLERVGSRDPGFIPFWGDAVESLVETGAVERADELTRRLERAAPRLEHPYRDALAARCRGLVASARSEHERAIAELEDSAARFEAIGMPFERARSLLALGVARRRIKRRHAARESLDAALCEFQRLPAPLWEAKARRELERIGGRPPVGDGELTATEERVVRLVVAGLSNKAVAAQLFVTVRTVEATLTHVYAKLGVRSRGELAARLFAEPK